MYGLRNYKCCFFFTSHNPKYQHGCCQCTLQLVGSCLRFIHVTLYGISWYIHRPRNDIQPKSIHRSSEEIKWASNWIYPEAMWTQLMFTGIYYRPREVIHWAAKSMHRPREEILEVFVFLQESLNSKHGSMHLSTRLIDMPTDNPKLPANHLAVSIDLLHVTINLVNTASDHPNRSTINMNKPTNHLHVSTEYLNPLPGLINVHLPHESISFI